MANRKKKLRRYVVSPDGSETFAISLVDRGAIDIDFQHFAKEEKPINYFASEEKHIVTGVALRPDYPIYRYDADSDFEYEIMFTKDSVKKMAYDYLRYNRNNNVTLNHDAEAEGVYMIESWILEDKMNDKSNKFDFGVDLPEGSWLVSFYIDSNDVWQKVKNGDFNGFSVESSLAFENFNKQEQKEDMEFDMGYWARLKEIIVEALTPTANNEQEFEEQTTENVETSDLPANPETQEVIDNTTENQVVTEEPVVEEKVEVVEENVDEKVVSESPVNEELISQITSLSELIKTLQEEVSALKTQNSELNETVEKQNVEIKQLESEPSSEPVNINAKPSGDAFKEWRKTMASLI